MAKILTTAATAAALLALSIAGCATTPPKPRQLVISQTCADLDFPIYFEHLSAHLTHTAEMVVADAGRAAKACTVASVSVVGLSGGKDPHHALLDLSAKRASAVAKALEQAGLPEPKFDVQAEATGEGPADPSREPMQRRAEVIIKFAH